MCSDKRNVLIIYGPTASGKSAFAIKIAKKIGGEIVNADSTQLYSELPILTAQPSFDDFREVTHHLYNFVPPNVHVDASLWLKFLDEKLRYLDSLRVTPIIVGGTGLYISALLNGLSYIPTISNQQKSKVFEEFRSTSREDFYEKLTKLDPLARRLHKNDTQRILRAMDVIVATGKSIFEWWKTGNFQNNFTDRYNFVKIYIAPKREIVYENCSKRFRQMLDFGVIEEVENFNQKFGKAPHELEKIIGFRELTGFLNGEIPISDAVNEAVKNTRHYAKRQYTWFNNKILSDIVIERPSDDEDLGVLKLQEILEHNF